MGGGAEPGEARIANRVYPAALVQQRDPGEFVEHEDVDGRESVVQALSH